MIVERHSDLMGPRYLVRVCLPGGVRRNVGTYGSRDRAMEAERKFRGPCRNCGEQAAHLHHIVPRAVYGGEHSDDLWRNAVALCSECHYSWHAHRLVITADKLEPQERNFAIRVAGADWFERHYPDSQLDLEVEFPEAVARLEAENKRLRSALEVIQQQLRLALGQDDDCHIQGSRP